MLARSENEFVKRVSKSEAEGQNARGIPLVKWRQRKQVLEEERW